MPGVSGRRVCGRSVQVLHMPRLTGHFCATGTIAQMYNRPAAPPRHSGAEEQHELRRYDRRNGRLSPPQRRPAARPITRGPLGAGPWPGRRPDPSHARLGRWIKEVARKFAHHGYRHDRAPSLLPRRPRQPRRRRRPGARRRRRRRRRRSSATSPAAMAFLRAQPYANGKVGVIGFCSGGRHTYLAACRSPSIDAAVDCWGGSVIVDDPCELNAEAAGGADRPHREASAARCSASSATTTRTPPATRSTAPRRC